MQFSNSADITREAMSMLPVKDYEDLVGKLAGHKDASVNTLKALIGAVNTEGQYKALKDSRFQLSKAADLVQIPFDPEEVLKRLGRKATGTAKAASSKKFSFRGIRKAAGGNIRKEAEKSAYDVIRDIRGKSDPGSIEKMAALKRLAHTRKIAATQEIKSLGNEIGAIVNAHPVLSRKFPELKKYSAYQSGLSGKPGAAHVVKWALLHSRLLDSMAELKLVNHVLEG